MFDTLLDSLPSFLFGGFLMKVFDWIIGKKRDKVEIDSLVSAQWEKLNEKHEIRVNQLERKLEELNTQYLILHLENSRLKAEIFILTGKKITIQDDTSNPNFEQN